MFLTPLVLLALIILLFFLFNKDHIDRSIQEVLFVYFHWETVTSLDLTFNDLCILVDSEHSHELSSVSEISRKRIRFMHIDSNVENDGAIGEEMYLFGRVGLRQSELDES